MRIAFYAPMKPPAHAVPSGDRQMARQLIRACTLAGHEVTVASNFCSFEKSGEGEAQRVIRDQGLAVAGGLAETLSGARRPDLWFTYHPYYKAPDWIGPHVAQSLGIPYVTAEASYSRRREAGAFAMAQAQVRLGLDLASVNFCFTPGDRDGIERLARDGSLVDLRPFIDLDHLPDREKDEGAGPVRLLAVGMMRQGDKLDSYRMLAESLLRIKDIPYSITIVGDGPQRAAVEAAFEFLGGRVQFMGEVRPEDLWEIYATADLYVWPGCGEAYGLAYLEAQAMGLPVVAQGVRGVPSVVKDGITGILVRDGDGEAYAKAIEALILEPKRRVSMGKAAQDFVREGRTIDQAARIIGEALA